MPHPLRVAVIGAGAFGRNHLRVLHELQSRTSSSPLAESTSAPESPAIAHTPGQPDTPPVLVQLAAVVDGNPQTLADAASRYSIPGFPTVDALLAANLDLHAAVVAVPTVAHAPVATELLEAGLDILVEKPLSATLAEADALIALAQTKGRILAAGHLERFNPSVTAALPRLTRPMFFEAHRLSVFTPRSLDVDVVLDLMIHDLDILLTMANARVTEVRAVGLPVLSRKVDIANVRLEFASGAIANLTASRVSTEQVRKLRLFQPAQYLSLDYARQELLTINVDPALAAAYAAATAPSSLSSRQELSRSTPERAPGSPASSLTEPSSQADQPAAAVTRPHPSAGLNFQKLDLPRAEPLRLELEDFLRAVHTRTAPRVTGQAARNALALALDINAAIAAHAQRIDLTPNH